jgi:hypothetical protein
MIVHTEQSSEIAPTHNQIPSLICSTRSSVHVYRDWQSEIVSTHNGITHSLKDICSEVSTLSCHYKLSNKVHDFDIDSELSWPHSCL